MEKIQNIKMEFPLLEACLPAYSFVDIDTIMLVCTAVFDTFQPLSCDVLASIIHKLNRTTCLLSWKYNLTNLRNYMYTFK